MLRAAFAAVGAQQESTRATARFILHKTRLSLFDARALGAAALSHASRAWGAAYARAAAPSGWGVQQPSQCRNARLTLQASAFR